MGNATRACSRTSRCPCADGDLIVTAGNDGQFRKLVEVLGRARARRRPAVRAATRTARPTARSCARCWSSGCATRPKQEWFDEHHRRRRAVRADQHHRRGRRVRRGARAGPGGRGGRGRRRGAVGAQPDHVLRDPGPATACRRRRSTSTATRSARWLSPERQPMAERPRRTRPRSAPRRRTRSPCSGRTSPRDVMGKVGFGELAFWLATQRRPTPGETRVFEAVLAALADHGFTPTAIVTRLTYLSAPGLRAGRAGGRAARRRLAVPRRHRGLRPVPARRPRRRGRSTLPTDDAGWDALALRDGDRPARGAAVRARPRPPRAQGRRPAHAAAVRDRRPRRGCSARTCRCSPRSAGCTRRCWAGRCRSTAPASAAPRWPTSGLPLELLRGFALLARTAGLIGQLAEELRHPVANDIFLSVDLNNRSVPPDPYVPDGHWRGRRWLSSPR